MTDTPITPALTPEQWETTPTDDIDFGDGILDSNSRHSAAALCLYGQPFGMSADDVALLTGTAEALQDRGRIGPMGAIPRLERLAAKIAALLPPQPPIVPLRAEQSPA